MINIIQDAVELHHSVVLSRPRSVILWFYASTLPTYLVDVLSLGLAHPLMQPRVMLSPSTTCKLLSVISACNVSDLGEIVCACELSSPTLCLPRGDNFLHVFYSFHRVILFRSRVG